MYEVRLPNACSNRILVSISLIYNLASLYSIKTEPTPLTDSEVEAGLSDACHSDSSSETERFDMEPNTCRYLV